MIFLKNEKIRFFETFSEVSFFIQRYRKTTGFGRCLWFLLLFIVFLHKTAVIDL